MAGVWHQAGCCCKCYKLVKCYPEECNHCGGYDDTPAYVDLTLAGISLCSCNQYQSGPDKSEAVTGNPNGTFRLPRTSACGYTKSWASGSPLTTRRWNNAACSGAPFESSTKADLSVAFLSGSVFVTFQTQITTYIYHIFRDTITKTPGYTCMTTHNGTNDLTPCWGVIPAPGGFVAATGGTGVIVPSPYSINTIYVTNDLSAEIGNVAAIDGVCYEIDSEVSCGSAEAVDAFKATIDDFYDTCEDCQDDL